MKAAVDKAEAQPAGAYLAHIVCRIRSRALLREAARIIDRR
jgi:hypothetical protein